MGRGVDMPTDFGNYNWVPLQPQYAAWIAANVPANPYGLCHKTCLRMQAACPELKLVRGHYYCAVWGERSHWWSGGVIRDITVRK